jgi:hypothetical protein
VLRLQRRDRAADCRLRQVKMPRGVSHVLAFGDGDKNA